MKFKVTKKVLTVWFLVFTVHAIAQDSRGVIFNNGWKFFKGDGKSFEESTFDDQGWRNVTLPHDWSVEGPFDEKWASATGYLPAGIGWYRKSFELRKDQMHKSLYLYFDGVYKNSEVWINGQYLGKRPNGNISFYYDITKYLNKKGKNVLAVKVDHNDFADSRWYTGSGIYRNVYLFALDPVHIDIWGIQFTTPEVTAQKGLAAVNVRVQNDSKDDKPVTIKVELVSPEGRPVAQSQANVNAAAGTTTTSSLNLTLEKPELWSPTHPVLYSLRTSIVSGGKVIDSNRETVGFRFFNFDANSGFTLNGVPTKLKGVCFHDDAGVFGAAVPAGVWERRLQTLKTLGCNAIRMSHNPHQDYLYELCDRLGFLVQDEAFDEWKIGKNKWIKGWNVGKAGNAGSYASFNEWSDRDVTDMILRNRNRTSIIMWSIGNEIDYPNDPYTHEVLNTGRNPQIYGKGFQPNNPPASELGEIAKRLVATAKKADASRPITAALAGVVMSNETTYPETLDLVGYNYQEYRYEEDHQKYPNRIIYGSENGKSYDAWKAVVDNNYIAGQFLWTAFDFLGEARSWPNRSSTAGLIDLAGFPKGQFYHRKALWTNEPIVYLSASKITERSRQTWSRPETHWNWSDGDSLLVTVFSNMPTVELLINGKSRGKKLLAENEDHTFRWKVKFEPGNVEAIGYEADASSKNHKLSTSGEVNKIVLASDRSKLNAHPDSVAHVVLTLRDMNNLPVSWTEKEIEITVSGPGKLLGIESGDVDSHENYQSNKRKTMNGKLMVFIAATGSSGVIKVEAKSNGLTTGTAAIYAIK